MKKLLIIVFILLNITSLSNAQDVIASISVSSRSVEGTDRAIYDEMQKSLNDMVNSRSWTPYELKQYERFRIRFMINVTERRSDTEFDAEMNIAMSRIVFSTNYESPILNFQDKRVHFYYNQFEPMEFIENSYTNNLVSVVAYYIYYALGLQFDTFQPSGGQEFFSKASNIVQVAQSSRESGWNSQDGDRSRFWLTEYILSPTYRGLRTFMYQYHRQGLDAMADNVEGGRTFVMRAIEELKKVYEERPGMYVTQMILDTKRDEIVSIFRGASESEKRTVIDIMKQIDPANSNKYDGINTAAPSSGFPSSPYDNTSYPPGGGRPEPGGGGGNNPRW
ncbi:MAG: DUF4835 family protein [Bacteroidales bacterium]|nr:DUF4835 family protein [Bacteroidales bacterium]